MSKTNLSLFSVLPLIFIFLLSYTVKPLHAQKKSGKKKEVVSQKQALENLEIFLDANKEKIIGNHSKAALLFAECIRRNPDDDASYYELASLLAMDKKYDDALIFAQKAVSINPKNEWYLLLLAELHSAKKQIKDAAGIYENLIKKYPSKLDYYYDLASLYLYSRKYKEAINVYNRLEKIIGVNEELCLQKQSVYLYTNNLKGAIQEIQKLIKAFPSESKYKILLADLYMDNEQGGKAFMLYEEVLKIDPKNTEVNLALADYYRSIGKTDLFFEQLKLAFLNPMVDIDSKVKILLSYFTVTDKVSNAEMLEQAYGLLDLLVQVHPYDAISYSMYADFLSRDNKNAEARDMFLKVVELDNSRYLVWEQLLVLESDMRNYTSLDTLSSKALELFPEQALLYLFSGFSNYMLKNYAKSIDIFTKGLQYAVFNEKLMAEFYMYLGDSYNHLKNYAESDAAYENALKRDPNNILVLNNYSYYLAVRGEKLERAKGLSKKANELKPNISSYQDTYAWVLFKMEAYNDALIWIEKALSNNGKNNPVIVEHYGDILYMLNRKLEAIEEWKKSKEMGRETEALNKKINTGELDL